MDYFRVFANLFVYFLWMDSGFPVASKPMIGEINAGPTEGVDFSSMVGFLEERGYLKVNKEIGQILSPSAITESIKEFQDFAGLPATGVITRETAEWMKKHRCGRPDKETPQERKRRRKRFVLQGSEWKKRLLTWQLEKTNKATANNDGISDYDVRRVFKDSLKKWSDITNIGFQELTNVPDNTADIRVSFGTLKHGTCPYPFDNKGSTLAHAFYPLGNTGLAGDVHYDDQEDFTIQHDAPRGKIKLLWVTVHELGHSLGLSHSKKRGAIMYPYYQHVSGADFNLTDDDVSGIQSLYGIRVKKPEPTQPPVILPTDPPTPGEKCPTTMNAAYFDDRFNFHVFKNKYHYVLNDVMGGVREGPNKVNSHFPKLTFVDTVFRRHADSRIVVFHGSTFSVYDGKTQHDSNRRISDGFQNMNRDVERIDAAIIWPQNNKLYVFSGEDYWAMRQLPGFDYIAEPGYPKKITASWRGLPKTIDTSFKWINEKVYFTKGEDYYRWDMRKNEVQSGYPQKLSISFLKCT